MLGGAATGGARRRCFGTQPRNLGMMKMTGGCFFQLFARRASGLRDDCARAFILECRISSTRPTLVVVPNITRENQKKTFWFSFLPKKAEETKTRERSAARQRCGARTMTCEVLRMNVYFVIRKGMFCFLIFGVYLMVFVRSYSTKNISRDGTEKKCSRRRSVRSRRLFSLCWFDACRTV